MVDDMKEEWRMIWRGVVDDLAGEWWMIRKGNGGYYKEVDPHHRPLPLSE